jgi:hypothetical protein
MEKALRFARDIDAALKELANGDPAKGTPMMPIKQHERKL